MSIQGLLGNSSSDEKWKNLSVYSVNSSTVDTPLINCDTITCNALNSSIVINSYVLNNDDVINGNIINADIVNTDNIENKSRITTNLLVSNSVTSDLIVSNTSIDSYDIKNTNNITTDSIISNTVDAQLVNSNGMILSGPLNVNSVIATNSITSPVINSTTLTSPTINGHVETLTGPLTANVMKISSINQPVTLKNLFGLTAGIFDLTPAEILNGAFYVAPAINGPIKINLPTNASMISYLQSIGINFFFNMGFNFTLANCSDNSITTVTISNSLDSNIQMIASSSVLPWTPIQYDQPIKTNITYTWLFNSPTLSYFFG